MPKILPDIRARQGLLGRPVLVVLIGSLLLCAVAFVGYVFWIGVTSPSIP